MENVQELLDGPKQFTKDSIQLIKKCTKPDQKGNFIIALFLSHDSIMLYDFFIAILVLLLLFCNYIHLNEHDCNHAYNQFHQY